METDETLYHATPQTMGKVAHDVVDSKRYSSRKKDLLSLPVWSDSLGIMGKIDIYKGLEEHIIERKYQLKQIYRGQLYQLWGQYFCMTEMGYNVKRISFYEIKTRKLFPQPIPGIQERQELERFIESFKSYHPSDIIQINPNKCMHCIYNPLCDKATTDYVY